MKENIYKVNIHSNAVVYETEDICINIINDGDCILVQASRPLSDDLLNIDEKVYNDKHGTHQLISDGRLHSFIKFKEDTAMLLADLLNVYGQHVLPNEERKNKQ